MLRADLHLHTTASDGQLRPADVVQLARKNHLNTIAITDHDTTDGVEEACQVANNSPVVIAGIELSAEENDTDVHMLGYYVQPENAGFKVALSQFQHDRLNRGEAMVAKLAALGKPVSWARVLELADGGSVGRPHVARAMVEARHVESINEAFDRYLHHGGPAYVSRKRMSPEEAIQLIHLAGGVAVMAHPGLVPDYLVILERLAAAGLDGVEFNHPRNPATVRENVRAIALRHNLIMTGGSDFHRQGDPMGAYTAPPESLLALRERQALY
ncbi:MAG: PHP domain-containing protein [Chloroflexi bacterium]|nr:PHP domain-containing protein [Chloroflexota bacterium]MCC6891967.1 PHP domain-containing protein [Anaerolineae bacterium]